MVTLSTKYYHIWTHNPRFYSIGLDLGIGGYSLHGSRRVFNFEDTAVKMVTFANRNQWLVAIALSNFTVHVAFVSEVTSKYIVNT